ncbi:MAG: hypothetical protein ACRD2B_15180 [Terriglobia bacterium]
MKIYTLLFLFGIFGLLLTVPSRASASNYYVSTRGSNSAGNGSEAHPWATVAYASTHAGPGTTVYVAAGVYHGSFTTSASGTASAYIRSGA